jgi:hypothetical protein
VVRSIDLAGSRAIEARRLGNDSAGHGQVGLLAAAVADHLQTLMPDGLHPVGADRPLTRDRGQPHRWNRYLTRRGLVITVAGNVATPRWPRTYTGRIPAGGVVHRTVCFRAAVIIRLGGEESKVPRESATTPDH